LFCFLFLAVNVADYWVHFALNAILERYKIREVPRDENELRTLFLKSYSRLQFSIARDQRETGTTSTTDAVLMQIMHQVFDLHPEWLDQRNNNQPPAIAPTSNGGGGGGGDDETSSVASSASSSNPPSSSRPRQTRPFKCTVCGKEFGYKHVLQNHERTHTGEKPFVCSVCNKCFTRDHHLKTTSDCTPAKSRFGVRTAIGFSCRWPTCADISRPTPARRPTRASTVSRSSKRPPS
jgi:hypothetical protein